MREADDKAIRSRWLALTRSEMPSVARDRGWPVTADHCFQRILLDNACEGCWYDHIAKRPAWRHAPIDTICRAVALGETAMAGDADIDALNARSLNWRRDRRKQSPPGDRV